MGTIATTAEHTASKGMKFLFAPQLFGKGSLAPLKWVLVSFVQMIAQFFASADLIPSDHRSLRPRTAQDARLGEVLALALHNVRKPGVRLDQYTVFLAVIALMLLLIVMAIYTASTLLLGTAHAAITLTFSNAACTYGAGTSFFTTSCGSDMAQDWIDTLFLGATPWWVGQAAFITPAMQAGLGAMFQTYSYAMLILAGFLVLYHLIVVIAGTAHEGRLGGRAMNQVWAPIRLIMAIGMLVPIGVNGLNSGQMIAIQTTKWGSALASNVWMAFANAMGNNQFVILPPMPQTVPVMKEALLILVCQHGYESISQEIALAQGSTPFNIVASNWGITSMADRQYQYKSWDYFSVANPDGKPNTCGQVKMLNPDFAPTGNTAQYLSSAASFDASADLRKGVLDAHEAAIDAAMAPGSTLDTLASNIYKSADGGNTNFILGVMDILSFDIAVQRYRADLQARIIAAISGSVALSNMDMTKDAMTRGWMSASVWFNSIAKVNGMLVDLTKAVPDVTSTFYPMIRANYASRIDTALLSARSVVAELPSYAMQQGASLAEPLSFTSTTGTGTALDQYLDRMAKKVRNFLGTTSGSQDEIAPAGALPAFASQLSLNTANPLAELAAIGHRMIDVAFKTNQASADKLCVAADAKKQGATTSENNVAEKCQVADNYDSGAALIVQSVTGALITSGITLAFILPIMPFVRFLFGIMTWIVAVFETVIAIPIVALAHIKTDGDGLAGSARTAYLLLLQVFLRPVLMIFGLIVALLVFNLMIVALNEFYAGAVRSAEGGGSVSALAAVIYTVMYVTLAYGLANASFKAIDMVPNQCLQWIGGATQQSIDGAHYANSAVGGVNQQISTAMPHQTKQASLQNDYYRTLGNGSRTTTK